MLLDIGQDDPRTRWGNNISKRNGDEQKTKLLRRKNSCCGKIFFNLNCHHLIVFLCDALWCCWKPKAKIKKCGIPGGINFWIRCWILGGSPHLWEVRCRKTRSLDIRGKRKFQENPISGCYQPWSDEHFLVINVFIFWLYTHFWLYTPFLRQYKFVQIPPKFWLYTPFFKTI